MKKAMKQYEKDWDAYDKAMGQWEQDMSDYYDRQEAAEEADSARYELENTSAKDFIADLYYYDGNTTSLVAEKVAVNNWRGTYSLMSSIWNSYPDEPMGFVTQWDPSTMEKIPLSDVIEESKEQSCSASWVMESKLRDAKNSGLLGIVVGNTCTFSAEGVKSVTFARDGSVAYTFSYDEENFGRRFRAVPHSHSEWETGRAGDHPDRRGARGGAQRRTAGVWQIWARWADAGYIYGRREDRHHRRLLRCG